MVERVSAEHPWPTSHLYTVPLGSDGYFRDPLHKRLFSLSHLGDQGSWGLLNLTSLWRLVGNTEEPGRAGEEGADSLRLSGIW